VEDQEKIACCAVVAPRDQTSTVATKQILGCTKLVKMMDPSVSVNAKSPLMSHVWTRRSVPERCQFNFSTCVHTDKNTTVTRLSLWLRRRLSVTKNTDDPTPRIEMVGNTFGWWKQHGHHFPTLSRFACRLLTISGTSCPFERLFSVTGQVDSVRRSSL